MSADFQICISLPLINTPKDLIEVIRFISLLYI